ncbi:MAG: bifunctional precorrin-2 dehydrogenase/sirohydrochlorin ferrochelatase [Acidimicrobiales bacterium]
MSGGTPQAPQFPVNLNIEGRPVLVVGGGRIALRKTEQLVVCGADITVVAPDIVPGFAGLPVTCIQRGVERGDIEGRWLVITATGVREVDQMVHDECNARRIWVNSADDPERCSFTLPAVVRRGDLMITVSTAGASPAVSSYLRARLAEAIGPEWESVVREIGGMRRSFHDSGRSTEDIDWSPLVAAVASWYDAQVPTARGIVQ